MDQESTRPEPPGAPAPGEEMDHRRLHRSALGVAAVTLLSRVTGLLREIVQARFLGAGFVADAFAIAFRIPNLFRRLVGEGAISSGLVPVLAARARTGDREDLRVFVEKFATLWTLILAGVTAGGMVLAGWLLSLPGGIPGDEWSPEKIDLAVQLTRWLFVYLFLIGLAAVAQGILNALGIFTLPAATPILFNLSFIASGYLLAGVFADNPEEAAAWAFAAGILAGGALQLAALLPSLWKRGIRFRPRSPRGHAGIREVLRLLPAATFGAGIYQINVLISSFIAMGIPGDGAVASLVYSSRLMEFVLGVFVFALSTVSMTTLARQAAAGDEVGFRSTLSEVIRLTLFITVPSAIGLSILGRPIIELLFKGGRFDARAVDLTLSAFLCYAPGLVFVGGSRVLISAFYAFKDVSTPVAVGAVNLVINAALCFVLSRTPMGHAGIALAATISAVIQAGILLGASCRRHRGLPVRDWAASLLRILAAGAVMGGVCFLLVRFLPPGLGKPLLALFVGAAVAAGAAVHLAVSWALGSSEARALKSLFGRWRRRREG